MGKAKHAKKMYAMNKKLERDINPFLLTIQNLSQNVWIFFYDVED